MAQDHSDGVMIAWMLPRELQQRLAVPGGLPAEELHITFVYLGKTADVKEDEVKAAAQAVARSCYPLEGKLCGEGRFMLDDGQDVLFLCVDVPGLEKLHEKLAEIAPNVHSDHGYTPHVSLKYVPAGEESKRLLHRPIPIRMETLTAVYGDKQHDFKIGSGDYLSADVVGTKPFTKSSKDVGPEAREKLKGLLQHYAKKKHPFTACVRDNRKRFGPGAEAVCATLKDIIRGTTYWRGNPEKDHGTAGLAKAAGEPNDPNQWDDATWEAYVEDVFDNGLPEDLEPFLQS